MVKFLILGIIQGLTEFLPVSSSGHLVIMQKILGMQGEELAISVVLHLGTTLGLIIFFSRDILGIFRNKKLLLQVILVTIITGIIGIAGKDYFESLFSSPRIVAIALIVTGVILISTRIMVIGARKEMGLRDALTLGVVQGFAIIPGISRSGITISSLMFRRFSPEASFRFSFLAAIPAVLGAVILEARHIQWSLQGGSHYYLVGFISSLITGMAALALLKIILRRYKFHWFGYYCIAVAIITLLSVK